MHSPSLTPPEDPDDIAAFKHVFRRHAAGVVAITARMPGGKPVGFTATSLASLAAVPPLATFNMARKASAWPAIEGTDFVCIQTLGARNRNLADKLASDHALRFAGDHWFNGPHDLPMLKDVTAWMIGRIIKRFPVANNAVVIVQIEEGGVGEPDDALLYHERTYRQPGRAL